MAEDQVKDETQDQQLNVKLEAKHDEDNTVYIGVDPENLFESLTIARLFGFGSHIDTITNTDIDEEHFIPPPSHFLMDLQPNGSEDKEIECILCSYRSYSKTHFKRHMARVHEKGFHCENCTFTCGSGDYLKEHIKAVHAGEKLKCKQCPSEFTWRSDLHRHVKGVHSGIVYACLVCSLKLSSEKSLKRHVSKSKCRLQLPPDFSVADLKLYIHSGQTGNTEEERGPVEENVMSKSPPSVVEKAPSLGNMALSPEKLFDCLFCGKKFNKKSYISILFMRN